MHGDWPSHTCHVWQASKSQYFFNISAVRGAPRHLHGGPCHLPLLSYCAQFVPPAPVRWFNAQERADWLACVNGATNPYAMYAYNGRSMLPGDAYANELNYRFCDQLRRVPWERNATFRELTADFCYGRLRNFTEGVHRLGDAWVAYPDL